MRKFAGLGGRIRTGLQALGYWRNGRPDVLRFCADKEYRPQYVYAWLKNRVPSPENLRRLAHDLDVSMAWIMFGTAAGEPSDAAEASATTADPARTRSEPAREPVPAPLPQSAELIDLAGFRDLTDKLVRLEAELTAVVEAFPDLYFWLDADGVFLSYRVGRGARLALPPEAFLGKRIRDAFPDAAPTLEAAFRQALDTDSLVTAEYTLALGGGERAFEARFIPLHDPARKGRKTLVVVRDITRRKRAEEVTQVLVQVGHELAETLDPVQAAERVVSAVFRLFGVRHAVLHGFEPASGDLICVAAAGNARPEEWVGRRLPRGVGISGRAVAERRAIWTPDALAEPRIPLPAWLRERIEAEGARAALGVPLVAHDRVVGALVLGETGGHAFSEEEIQLASAFADQAALALQNAQFYAEAERRGRRAAVVAGLARTINGTLELGVVLQRVAEGAKELCGSDVACVALPEPGSEGFAIRYLAGARVAESWIPVVEWGQRVGGQALVTGRPFRTDNYAEDPRITKDYLPTALAERIVAELAVPIRVGARIEGLLYVANRAAQPFTDADETVLAELADHAGIAIRNARLFAESERRRLMAEGAGSPKPEP